MTNPTASLESPAIADNEAAINPANGKLARTRLAVLLLGVGCFPVLGANLISPVLPLMSKQFADVAGSSVLVPLVLTVPSLAIGITAAFAGSIVDRIGRKRMLLIALLVYAILGTAPLYLGSLWGILISRFGVGITEAALVTASTALMTDYFHGKRRNRYLSLSTLVSSVSAAVFLAIGGVLGESGWRTPFWLYAVSLLLFVPVLIAVWEPRTVRRDPVGATRAALSRIPANFILMPIILGFLVGVTFYTILVELPYVLTNLGVSNTRQIGVFTALMALAAAAGAVSFRWTSRFGPRGIVPPNLVVVGVGFILMWIAPGLSLVIVGGLLASFGSGMLIPTSVTWCVARLSLDQRGRGIGRHAAMIFTGEFLSPLVIAGLAVELGSLNTAIGFVGIFNIAAAVVFAVVLFRSSKVSLVHTVA